MEQGGLNLNKIKNINTSSILYLLNSNSQLSRKDIADKLKLTPAAVTKICNRLIEKGAIEEVGEEKGDSSHAGRKKILLKPTLDKFFILGINAEVDNITISISCLNGDNILQKSIDSFCTIDKIISESKHLINNSNISIERLLCASICVIGSKKGSEFGLWDIDEMKLKIENELKLDAIFENNIRAFALAEMIYSNVGFESSVLFLKWGPGIGSAIASRGEVLSGNDAGIAEIGHYIVNKGGRKCRCGRYGCLETEVSSIAMLNECKGYKTLDDIINSSDEEIIHLLDEKIDTIALALTNTATILNAKRIILLGSVFNNEDIAARLSKQCIRYNAHIKESTIKLSSLNSKISYIGPVALAAKYYFFEKSWD